MTFHFWFTLVYVGFPVTLFVTCKSTKTKWKLDNTPVSLPRISKYGFSPDNNVVLMGRHTRNSGLPNINVTWSGQNKRKKKGNQPKELCKEVKKKEQQHCFDINFRSLSFENEPFNSKFVSHRLLLGLSISTLRLPSLVWKRSKDGFNWTLVHVSGLYLIVTIKRK